MTQTASGGRDGNAARSRAAKSGAALAKLRVWLTRIRSHAFWANLTSPRTIWHGMIFIFGWIYTLLVKLPWAIAVVVIATIVFQGLTQHATVIKPISVPKDLADSGYTAEVAGQRLRDAMAEYMGNIHAHKRSPDIALHGELPSIMVPTVGISLDAIVSSVRTLLRSTRSRTIGGEITVRDKLLWLSLRLDDQRFLRQQERRRPQQARRAVHRRGAGCHHEHRPVFRGVYITAAGSRPRVEIRRRDAREAAGIG